MIKVYKYMSDMAISDGDGSFISERTFVSFRLVVLQPFDILDVFKRQ